MAGRQPRQQRGFERRTAILEAAGRSFDVGGYDGSALADIARGAGSTLGGLAFYFPHKDDLARAVIEEQNARTFSSLAKAAAGFSPAEAMIHSSRVIADQLLTDPVVRAGIRLSMENAGLAGSTRAFYIEWMTQVEQLFDAARAAGELVEGISSHDLAVTAISYFTGVHTVDAALADRCTLFHHLLVMWRVLVPALASPTAREHLMQVAESVFGGTQPSPVRPGGRADDLVEV